MLDRFGTNPTQLTGLLSFLAATVACLIAAWRSDSRDARVWKALVVLNCLFFLEIVFGLRHRVHDLVTGLLMEKGTYTERRGTQEMIIVSFGPVALIFVLLPVFWRKFAEASARVAMSLSFAVLALFITEAVSLHAIDAIFYRWIGPVYVIGWLWAIAAIGICLAAIQV